MDQHLLEAIINSLVEKNKKMSFITIDDLMDALDEYKIPITKTDYVASMVNGIGLRIFDHIPTEEELLALEEDVDETKDPDYAQIDYEEVFREVLEIDPGLEGLVSYIREVRPAQHGEAKHIFRHITDEGKKRVFDMSLRAVVRISLGISKTEDVELADLIQQGSLGLLTAIEKYDVNDESVFGSYANFWIFQYISRSISFRKNGCYFPVHASDTIKRVIVALEKHGFEDDNIEFDSRDERDEIIQRISIDCGIATDQVVRILGYLKSPVSIDEIIELEDEGDLTFSDNGNFETAMFNDIAEKIQKDNIEKVLSLRLNERQEEIIKLRYGFYDGRCYTLEECGEKYDLTRERIRQIEAKAIRKLSHYFTTFRKQGR